MSEPTVVSLTDLDSFTREFVVARPFRFHLEGEPERVYEVKLKPLTEAEVAKARSFTQIAPPKAKVQKKNEQTGQTDEVEEDDWGNPEFIRAVNEQTALRVAFVLTCGFPDLKIDGDLAQKSKIIQEKFPPSYAAALEREILKRSTNDLAIVNLASFSLAGGSDQS
jgi:hypothetical protein